MIKTITFTIETTDCTPDLMAIAYDSACDLLKHLINNPDITSVEEQLFDSNTPAVISPSITVSIVDIV